ncbi:MAG: iron ABC transporter permease [Chloroflexota bacterium]|nr:iron ABC transporter permease [Chloroflexota bacterium]
MRLIVAAFSVGGRPSLANLQAMFADTDVVAMARNTLVLTLGGAAVATALGTLIAITVTVVPSRRSERRALQLVPAVPFTLPPIVGAIGWLFLLAPRVGWLNILLRWALRSPAATGPVSAYSLPVVIGVTGLYVVPYVYTVMATSLSRLSTELLEGYQVCGATAWGAMARTIAGPLRPAFMAAVTLAIMHSLSQFSIPLILGLDVLTTHMYRQITFLGDYGAAAAVGLPLLVVAVVLTTAQLRLTGQGGRAVTLSARGTSVRPFSLGRASDAALRWIAYAYVVVAGLLPISAIVLVSFLDFWQPSFTWSDLRPANYLDVWNNELARAGAMTSLTLGIACAIAATALALLVVVLVERGGGLPARAAYFFANLPLGIPLVLFGLAMLLAFISRPIVLYGTIWILVLAYVVAFLPVAVRNVGPVFQQIARELEEAAAMSGAPWHRVARRITVPLVMPGLTASAALLFILIFREFSIAAFVSTPSTNVIAMSLLAFNDSGNWPYVAVLSVFLSAVSIAGIALTSAVAGRFEIGRGPGA